MRKNQIDIGLPVVSFLDNNGFRLSQKNYQYTNRLRTLSLDYSHMFREKWQLSASYVSFGAEYIIQNPGQDRSIHLDRWFHDFKIGVGYNIFSRKLGWADFTLRTRANLNFRKIIEWAVEDYDPYEWFMRCVIYGDRYQHYDLGVGTALNFNLVFRRRFSLGADLTCTNYWHLNDKQRAPEGRYFSAYTPNRKTLVARFQLGVIF